jgi:hypothetical protein
MWGFLLEAASPVTQFACPRASLASSRHPWRWDTFIYSLIHAVHGAKGHTSVLAAKISLRTSNGCAEPRQRKRTPASTIAVETVEAAQIQIRMRGSVGYFRHWVTALWARMHFNSIR